MVLSNTAAVKQPEADSVPSSIIILNYITANSVASSSHTLPHVADEVQIYMHAICTVNKE